MIEVIISLLLVTVSALGILALNAHSTREVAHLKFQNQAEALGQQLLMRASINANTANRDVYAVSGNTALQGPNCMNATCSDNEIANKDIADWTQELTDALPNSSYQAQWNQDNLIVAIKWQGIAKSNNTNCLFDNLQPNESCRTYVRKIL